MLSIFHLLLRFSGYEMHVSSAFIDGNLRAGFVDLAVTYKGLYIYRLYFNTQSVSWLNKVYSCHHIQTLIFDIESLLLVSRLHCEFAPAVVCVYTKFR